MHRSTTKLILTAVIMIAALASSGLAQQIVKVGVVNSQEVLEKSAEGKRVLAQLDRKSVV